MRTSVRRRMQVPGHVGTWELERTNVSISAPNMRTSWDNEELALTQEQVNTYSVDGWFSTALLGILAIAVLYMMVKHCLAKSVFRKCVFHLLLFLSVAVMIPPFVKEAEYARHPSWVFFAPLEIYSVIFQSGCKVMLTLFWSQVVSTGQEQAQRRDLLFAYLVSILLFLFAAFVPLAYTNFSNDKHGHYDFLFSYERTTLMSVALFATVLADALVLYHGFQLRRRLLLVEGPVPAESIHRTLNQLLLTIGTLLIGDITRILSVTLSEAGVVMPLVVSTVLRTLVPTMFPTICMLYLMRRVTVRRKNWSDESQEDRVEQSEDTLSRYMTEMRYSSVDPMPAVLGVPFESSTIPKMSLPSSYASRMEPQSLPATTTATPVGRSPAMYWTREWSIY